MTSTLSPEDDIFQDEDVLRDHYPERILERDEKINEYLQMFKPVVRNKRPRNVFVHGQTGVGKTIATKAVFQRIIDSIEQYDYDSNKNIDEPSVRTIHLECKDLNTSYQVGIHLVNELRSLNGREEINTTGYPAGEVYSKLFAELRAVEHTHVLIALDEIDNIGEDDNVLYKLGRANDDNSANHVDPESTKVGIIGITNDPNFQSNLDPRVKSTLCEQEVYFPPYDANELNTILTDRAKNAFHDGAVEDSAIALLSGIAAKRDGFARTGLNLLYKAGQRASNEDAGAVTEEHVRSAEDALEQDMVLKTVNSLSTHAKLVAYTLVKLDDEDELPAKIDKLYAWYEMYGNALGVDPLTSRSVHEILNELMLSNIAECHEENKGLSGGRYYEYELCASKSVIITGLADDTRLNDLDDDRL
ncbi:Cdc6/Cdc18 family protein [Halosimplex amylolyticum]|uniref:Cdc6/Cdc18 family protein n=1 Tax=Halosimplex amylolyticum TaxID=3396616 RepID=UPI003F57E31A